MPCAILLVCYVSITQDEIAEPVYTDVQKGKTDKHNCEPPFCKEGEQSENYTKYRLKAAEELAPFLAETDNVFVVACNKCFKAFETMCFLPV